MKRFAIVSSVLTLAVAISLSMLMSYWVLWPYQIVTLASHVVPTDKRTYLPGERVSYELDYCKFVPLVGQISRALVDGVRVSYPTTSSFLSVGCRKVWISDLRIPLYTPPGVYHLEMAAQYDPNPFRTIVINYETKEFVVIPRADSAANQQQEIDDNRWAIQQLERERLP